MDFGWSVDNRLDASNRWVAVAPPDGTAILRLSVPSPVLGIFNDWDCSIAERRLCSGDTLALYTDGVTESFDHREEEFGEQRLIEALRRYRELSSQDMLRSIVDEVQRYSSHEQHDDITLIVASAIRPSFECQLSRGAS